MRVMAIGVVSWAIFAGAGAPAQMLSSSELRAKIDEIVVAAYQAASSALPCKMRPRGPHKLLRWQDVDSCINDAYMSADWEELAQRVSQLRGTGGSLVSEIPVMVEASLSAHALRFDKVFVIGNPEALLPLTNSLLKFLPPDSLMDVAVFTKEGARIGTFAGVYAYDKSGGLSAANSYRMSAFQYADANGNIQTPSAAGRLLLDSYAVPWKDALAQPGFRIPADKLIPKQR